jgi:hypothetical protein
MDLCDQDDGDLLSRVLEQAAATTVPPRAARPRDPGTGQPGEVWTLPGILGPTRVTTSFGHVPAHLVRVGDTLRTQDGSYERVRRISDLKIDEDFLARHPEAAPVVLRRGSLEKGLPHQDVLLSPAQQVALGPNRFEARPVAAGDLSRERGGIDKSLGMMVYLRFHLDRPAQICCDGVWVAAETD